MNEQVWKRKEYESWDEAFRGLSPIIRQQSVRIAAYTRELFVAACQMHFGAETKDGEARMRGAYADLAYKCGMYHQLGKALVPHEYQILQKDFTEEEEKVYQKYTTDGRLLVATLQEKTTRARERRKGVLSESPTSNIPFLMLRESCEQHMERFDGSGYPKGLKGEEISPIAQLVGLAKELDRLASETKSETPFEFAIDTLMAGKDVEWSAPLLEVLEAAKQECREVYIKYIVYTRTLPKTIPLVEKRPDRKMGLKYRPMVSDISGTVTMYEAVPWFGGIAEQPDETETVEDLRDLFKRTSLVEPLSWYFLYEAADTMVRIRNCRLAIQGIVVQMIPEFYQLKSQLQKFYQLFIDQAIEKDQLILTIPSEFVKNASKTALEIVQRYTKNGIRLLLDGFHFDDMDTEQLKRLGLTTIRLSPDLYLNRETANKMQEMMADGFVFIGGEANDSDMLAWLVVCGTSCSSGTITGNFVNEDELIHDSLARESMIG
ncbi:MAG: EAL domain-containing protein [Clostridia bacterium]|nr:EAL domain-containing protein [Clostridia bacterium]